MPFTANLQCVKDAHVYSGTSNFNETNYVACGATTTDQAYGFFAFDPSHGIPDGAIVTGARFYGYITGAQESYNKTLTVRPANGAWTETGITGVNKPVSTGVSCDIVLGYTGDFFDVDISAIALAWFGGSFTYANGFYVTASGTTTLKNIGSRTRSTTSQRPYIVIEYMYAASKPTTSTSTVVMGNAVTINTNRSNSSYTHTLEWSFKSASGVIGTGIATSATWTPAITLAQQIPNTVYDSATITCKTYNGETLIGTETTNITLEVPASVKPTANIVSVVEAVAGIATQFSAFVQGKSKLTITLSAAGAEGSTIINYSTTVNGKQETGSTFTTNFLTTAGTNTISVVVTDSRNRTSTAVTQNFTVVAYSVPAVTSFTAERCNAAGTAVQVDGSRVWISLAGSVSSVGDHNTISCKVYYKLASASTWTQADTITPSGYTVSNTNYAQPVGVSFDTLSRYNLKVEINDYFSIPAIAYAVVGTKRVVFNVLANGTGIAFGEIATISNAVKITEDWQLLLGEANLDVRAELETLMPIVGGGLTAASAATIRTNIGAQKFLDVVSGSMNDIVDSGQYFIRVAVTDKPYASNGILCVAGASTDDLVQLFIPSNSAGNIYKRSKVSTWGNWIEFRRMGEVIPATDGGTGTTSLGALLTLLQGLGAWTGVNMEIKHGILTTTSAGVTVTFDTPFPGTPFIMAMNHGGTPTALSTQTITASSFVAKSAASTGSFEWLAICIPGITYTPS